MKLLLKVNVVLIVVFLLALALSHQIAARLLQENARGEIEDRARFIMESTTAVRSYTSAQISPILSMHSEFLPQSIAAYSAVEYFTNLRQKYPDYAYKEALLNPTNPRDRAVNWEVRVVNQFRDSSDTGELIGERESASGKTLYLARPLEIRDEQCLACHGRAADAPPSVLARYGSRNGFGWQVGDVIGARIVSVPFETLLGRTNATLRGFVYMLVGTFVCLFLAINILLVTLVTRPIRKLAAHANEVSLGNLNAPDFRAGSSDEIAALGLSFNRLRTSLEIALKNPH
jgi:HAMP domain-containing protein